MVKNIVQEIIANIIGVEDLDAIKVGMSLSEHLNMDDSEIGTLLEAAEAEWDLDLIDYAPELETVGDVIAYIKSQL